MMASERTRILRSRSFVAAPASRRRASEMVSATPTMKTKNGKIRSVGVQPFHSACWSGA